jgi:hypothetical protein
MNLGELLRLLRGGILNDRTDRVAGTSDYLWTDEELVTYINEAQRRFAVRGLVLRDGSTDEVTRIALEPGQNTYTLHPSVIAVVSARREEMRTDLQRVGHSLLNAYTSPSTRMLDPVQLSTLQPGATTLFSTDEELVDDDNGSRSVVTLRTYPIPSADMAGKHLRLRVIRKPIERLCLTNLSAVPELPEDHHIEMLDFAAYMALSIADDDAGNASAAANRLAMFERNVVEARKTAMRKLFAPTGWGFGRGGYVWDS